MIDGCKSVDNGDCFRRAVFLAFHTADTAVFAFLADNCAFFMVGTGDDCFFCFGNKRNDMVGTFAYAKSAAAAFSRVNVCNAVYNADCIVGTDGCTVAAAKTAIKTGAFAAVKHFCGCAGIKSLIDFFINLFVTVAAAMYERGKGFGSLSFYAKDFADCIGGFLTAGAAKVCFGAGDFGKSFCISITAGKTACTAVCTGKAFANFCFDGVNFYSHEVGGKNEKKGTCKADTCNNKSGSNN